MAERDRSPIPRDDHSSGTAVAGRLKRPTRATARRRAGNACAFPVAPIRSCSRRGLPCLLRCRPSGALLPHPFTLTATDSIEPARRFAFCGAFPGVAPAGRYPAPCLRGARTFLYIAAAVIRPTGLLWIGAARARVNPRRACARSDSDDDFPDLFVRFHVAMRFDNFLQGETARDQRLEDSRREPLAHEAFAALQPLRVAGQRK